jgi:RNA polymerase sigma-70 factor (ECF subfamily)
VDAPTAFRQQLLGAIPRLRRYARSLVFDASTADDLVQTALERALAHWHQFDQRRDILVWTISIAHNAYMDDRRRNARFTLVTPHESQPDALHDLADAGSADVGLRIDLLAALEQLPLEQREPLLLVALEQFSYAEVAEVLRIPIGTVMSRISRGRAALRALLDGGAAAPVHAVHPLRRVV